MTECTVCGNQTHPAEEIDAKYGGELYEFCSDECKASFQSNPETFAE